MKRPPKRRKPKSGKRAKKYHSMPRKGSKQPNPKKIRAENPVRTWSRRAAWSLVVFLVGHMAGSALDLWGPLWPTTPRIEVESGPSSAFSIPFYLINDSALFDLKDVTIYCAVGRIDLPRNTVIEDAAFKITNKTIIQTGAKRPFRCRIVNADPDSAMIGFSIDYQINLLIAQWPRSVQAGPFHWDKGNARWILGEPLN